MPTAPCGVTGIAIAGVVIVDTAAYYAGQYLLLLGMTTGMFDIVQPVVEGVIVARVVITLSLTMILQLLYTFLSYLYFFPLHCQVADTFSAFCQGDSLFTTQSVTVLGLSCPVCLRGPVATWRLRPWGSNWVWAEADYICGSRFKRCCVSLPCGKVPAQPASQRSVIHSSHYYYYYYYYY